jgi:hypothetical protein
MTNTTSTNPFTNLASFDPMQYFAASQQQFAKLVGDAQGRAQQFADQYPKMESEWVARSQAAIVAMAQMAQDAIAYGAQLSAEARKLTMQKLTEAQAEVQTATQTATKTKA